MCASFFERMCSIMKKWKLLHVRIDLPTIGVIIAIGALIISFHLYAKTALIWYQKQQQYIDKAVTVTIIDVYHKDEYTVLHNAGNVLVPITHEEECVVYVKYNQEEYQINGKEDYEYCKSRIGEQVDAIKRIYSYQDDSSKEDIIDIIIPYK